MASFCSVETRRRRPLFTVGFWFICIRLNRPFKLSKSQLGQTTCLAVTAYGSFLNSDSSPDTDSQKHNLDVLQIIFSAHLSRHAQFEENLIFNLRIGAAMMQLWGENDPRPWLECSSDQFDLVVESRMLLFHALEKTRLKQIKDVGIRWVSVLSSRNGDECSICQSDTGKKYSVNSVPILPHE